MNTIDVNFERFIQNPSCLWDLSTTNALVQLKWATIKSKGTFSKFSEYSTAGYLSKKIIPDVTRVKLDFSSDLESYLEDYSEEHIRDFYAQNELVPIGTEQLKSARMKLNKAISLFNYPGGPLQSINLLVRSIHVLRQDDPEIDISHSDPSIPFSIFVSVCDDDSPISFLRLAEGILHEAMHLNLTLIEDVVPLIKPDSKETFYSPWRKEPRPILGILHGAFVFKAVFNFYIAIKTKSIQSSGSQKYTLRRIEFITEELNALQSFRANDLTDHGQKLARSLVNGNIL